MKNETSKRVTTRFPPSPTGFLHVGGARTALFNYLFAKHSGGSVLFRLEDTDAARSKKEFELSIMEGLAWLGITFGNVSPVRQSERLAVYKEHLKKLVDSGSAYFSKEKIKEAGDRPEVIRFKNPNKKVTFVDLIRGEISFDTKDLGDFVIAKSLEEPMYHLAVVVDDFEMGVTHVIRGEDGISNTPRQILIAEALGFPRPQYAHIPLILALDRSKLSKRHGAVPVTEYRDNGFLPEAVVNYLVLLGWNPGTDREIWSMKELIKEFDLSKVQKGGAVFNIEKLKWINKRYMKELSPKEKIETLRKLYPELSLGFHKQKMEKTAGTPALIELISERASTFGEVRDFLLSGEFDYFFTRPVYQKEALLWKGKGSQSAAKERLTEVRKILASAPAKIFTKENVKRLVWPYAEKQGMGEVLWPFRMSLSGREKSPDPFVLSEMLGREEVIERITLAVNLLS